MTGRKQPAADEGDRSAGRAAGYCWDANPNGPGHCTWPPGHPADHRDVYAHTKWPWTRR